MFLCVAVLFIGHMLWNLNWVIKLSHGLSIITIERQTEKEERNRERKQREKTERETEKQRNREREREREREKKREKEREKERTMKERRKEERDGRIKTNNQTSTYIYISYTLFRMYRQYWPRMSFSLLARPAKKFYSSSKSNMGITSWRWSRARRRNRATSAVTTANTTTANRTGAIHRTTGGTGDETEMMLEGEGEVAVGAEAVGASTDTTAKWSE